MNESSGSRRLALVRASLMFQLKLLADGFRDFLLVPVSLAATVIGLVRSGAGLVADRRLLYIDLSGQQFYGVYPEEQREYPERFRGVHRVLDVGRATERWINLFDTHEPSDAAGNLDQLVTRAERLLHDQVRRGDVSESAGAALSRSLDALHRRAREAGTEGRGREALPEEQDEAQ